MSDKGPWTNLPNVGRTALHHAVFNGHTETVLKLLDGAADPRAFPADLRCRLKCDFCALDFMVP